MKVINFNRMVEDLEAVLKEWELDVMSMSLAFIGIASGLWCIVYVFNKLNGGN